jgi:hypothetical protein
MADKPQNGLKKRQQIDNTGRKMFFWVAGASVVVSFAIVGLIFLVQKGLMNMEVINAKGETVNTMKQNVENAKELSKSVKKLNGDRSLGLVTSKVKTSNNLDKIFGALPYEEDTVPLAASLQDTLLLGITLESLSLEGGAVSESSDSAAAAPEQVGSAEIIGFSFKATGSPDDLKNMFQQLNSSIRPISITSLSLEPAGQGRLTASVSATTYYQAPKVFKLGDKVVK